MPRLTDRLLRRYIAAREHPGKYRIVRWLGRNLMSKAGIVAKVHPGVTLRLNPVDWVEYLLLRDGRYEPLTLSFIQRNLRPSETAIFAGVNNGLHTIVAALAVGASGRVIGCEPQPAALLRARQNIAINGISDDRLRLVAVALGNDRGLARMPWPPADNPGQASFFHDGPGFTVPLLTLAEVAQSLGLGRIRLLLLDVQGYEVKALQGLGALRPEIVILEDSEEYCAKSGQPREALYQLVRGLGYALFDIHGLPVASPGDRPERNLVGLLAQAEMR
jgi:FkbM family methyltransferase